MLLIVTNKYDEHADILIAELHARSIPFRRLNTEDYPQKIKGGIEINSEDYVANLVLPGGSLDLSTITSVWYRRPKFPVIKLEMQQQYLAYAREQSEAFLQNLWFALKNCLWVNHPHANRAASFRGVQLKLATEMGFRIPKTLIVNDPSMALDFAKNLSGKIVVKSLNHGIVHDGDEEIIPTTHLLTGEELKYLEDLTIAPCVLQEYIEKSFELRITVIGGKIFAAAIYSQEVERAKIDWRMAPSITIPHIAYELPTWLQKKLLAYLEAFDLQFGAIDMIVTPSGEYIFLEINPSGQWYWIEQRTGMPMLDAMINLLTRETRYKN